MSGPHDRFLRYILDRTEWATALLRAVLPKELAARVEWSTLRREPTAIVSAEMRETRGDLVYTARVRGSGRTAFILVERG